MKLFLNEVDLICESSPPNGQLSLMEFRTT